MMLLALAALALLALYFYFTRNHRYWAKRNVKFDAPLPLFGNHLPTLMGKRTDAETGVAFYNKYPDEKIVGYYRGNSPELIIRDPEIVKHILNTDFPYFHARGIGRDTTTEPLMMNLFSVDGDCWRLLRQRLSAAFTGAKLRRMFPLVERCARKLQRAAARAAATGAPVDACDLMARFTIEFIGACGFGVEMHTINDEHSSFQQLGKLIFNKTTRMAVVLALRELFPDIKFIQRFNVQRVEVRDAIVSILKKIRQQRGGKPSDRNDFVDLLLELEMMGKIRGKSLDLKNPDGTPTEVELEMDLLCQAAQMYIFFAAGYETSSTATSFTLHQLSFHPDIQHKIQEEIDVVLARYDNRICYDAVAEMTLLDMAFKEALRIFPPGGYTFRVCTRPYSIPGTDVTIDAGIRVMIPFQALHMDPKYFEEPTEFRPERFLAAASKERPRYVYLPFGEGPRQCIGYRLGHMQSLAGLAALLQRFVVAPAPGARRQHAVRRNTYLVQAVDGGLPLRLAPRPHTAHCS